MEIKLYNLYMKNFKGIKEKALNFEGKDKVIEGVNEAGKTTVNDAFAWLLNDENSNGDSRFGIKPLDENNNVIHKLNTIVEGVLSTGENNTVTLKKKYYEKWTREKGSTKEKFKGNTTDYFINDNKMSKTDYENYIRKNIIKVDMLKLLTDPLYFNENLHWKKQREIIFNIADDVDLGELATKTDTYYLIEEMDGRSLEEYEDILDNKLDDIDEKIEKIPTRIDEIKKGLSTEGLDQNSNIEDLESRLEGKQEKQQKLQEKIAELKTGNSTQNKIMEIKEKKQKVKHKLLDKANELLSNLRNEKDERVSNINRANDYIENLLEKIETENNKAKKVNQKLKEEKEKEFNKNNFNFVTCPSCGEEFSPEDIDKHRKEFNKEKAENIKEYKNRIQEIKSNIENAENAIKITRDEILSYVEGGDDDPLSKINARIERGKQFKKEVNNGQHKKLEAIQDKIDKLKNNNDDSSQKEVKKKKEKLKNINEEINKLQKKIANLENIEEARERIAELNETQDELMKKYEKFEKQLYDLEKMKMEKIKLLEDKVNDMFEITNFKLFKKLQNGKVKETCVALKDGVPFDDMNTGSKYQIGLDIINTLSEKYNISAPVFIDNRERIAKLPAINSQTIHLIMKPSRQNLKMVSIKGEEEAQEIVKEATEEVEISQESLF